MSSSDQRALAERIAHVRDTIAQAAVRAGRRPEDVRLIAVSKTVDAAAVVNAAQVGVDTFGENRVQEAATKLDEINRLATISPVVPLRWHLIGHLQSNKARLASRLFAMVESVDSLA